jgi:hypothetical protein
MLPLLAAAGFDAVRAKPALRKRMMAAGAVLALGLLVLVAGAPALGDWLSTLRPAVSAVDATASVRTALLGASLSLGVPVALLYWLERKRWRGQALLLALAAAVQVIAYNWNAYETVPGDVYDEPPLAATLRAAAPDEYSPVRMLHVVPQLALPNLDAAPGAVRARALNASLMKNVGIAHGVSYASSYVSSEEGFTDALWQNPEWSLRMVRLFGVQFLALPAGVNLKTPAFIPVPGFEQVGETLLQTTRPLPFAHPVEEARFVEHRQEAVRQFSNPAVLEGRLALLEDFEPHVELDDSAGNAAASNDSASGAEHGSCRLLAPLTDDIDVGCDLGKPGHVVINASHHPNFRGYVDDVEVPIRRANALVMAVFVPEGQHRLHLRYEESSFGIGCIVSLLGLLLCGLLWYRNTEPEDVPRTTLLQTEKIKTAQRRSSWRPVAWR